MMQIFERIHNKVEFDATLTLPFELRQRSRLSTHLDNGEEAVLFLPRGSVLRHGDLLRADVGKVVVIQAASEEVSTASTASPLLLAKACYHLGNRHVALHIGTTCVRYLRDHVLDDLVCQLGLTVTHETLPFEPEAGAYAHAAHSIT